MRRVFADAFFYIAVLNRNDAAHEKALGLLTAGIIQTVTTTAVLLEVADAMASPARRAICAEFLQDLVGESGTVLRRLDDALWQRSLDLYRSRPDKAWSFTDCVSFVVMGEEGLTEALTGDRHFEQAGFLPLLA